MSTWDPNERDEPVASEGRMAAMRSLMNEVVGKSQMVGRSILANMMGYSFHGNRNMFRALGYDRVLTPQKYRWRYERGGIIKRLNDAKPIATWRGGGELVEDEDPDTTTTFESSWKELNERLNIWTTFERTDILAGLGRYAVMLIGAPGDLSTPLVSLRPNAFAYIQPFSERDARIESLDTDTASVRFGLPNYYNFSRLTAPLEGIAAAMQRRVHFSRVFHVPSDGLLDDRIFGQPRQEIIWNYLDDLDKVVGGGAEAFWKRVDAGMQLKMDPTIADMKTEDKAKLDEQLEEYVHGLRRVLKTRGIDIETLTSSVAGIKDPVMTIVSLISAAVGIPQRILLGSERGELASSMDRDEWGERIQDRRISFAGPMIVRPFVQRMIDLGVLPKPKTFDARWPSVKTMDEAQKVLIAKDIATINQSQGETVVTVNEIRDRYLDLPPIEDVMTPEELAAKNAPTPEPGAAVPPSVPSTPAQRAAKWAVLTVAEKQRYVQRVSAKRKETQWKPIHTTADRFSRRRSEARA